ncbi:MAG: hypothetical protein KF812_03640 [Fimbriimonadaceae bacterium]|nr:hypothetical protein [Fimbriimonadaceae bacterium]
MASPAQPWTLGVAQFAPKKGDVPANLDRIAALCRQAAREDARLLVMPESAVSGYFLEGAAHLHSLSGPELGSMLTARLGELTNPVDLLVGFYEKNEGRPYNSVAYLRLDEGKAELGGVYRKIFLPTYGVFDEARFHAPGNELGLFETRVGKVGCLICEDVWHSIMGSLLALRGAEVIAVPSASPARGFAHEKPGNLLRYERMLKGLADEHGVYAVASMLCGFEGGKGFTGGSFAYGPDGEMLDQAPLHEEALILVPIHPGAIETERRQTPLLEDLKEIWPLIKDWIAAE